MPRPKKLRMVCQLPQNGGFVPERMCHEKTAIVMSVDEYETIRLIDKEGFSQEDCGNYMEIARTTVQQIYTNARKKMAIALVEGRALKIEGGDYQLCDGKKVHCKCGCHCHQHCKERNEES